MPPFSPLGCLGVLNDSSGGVIARGHGPGGDLIRATVDSTDIYRALYLGLFERRID